MPPLPFPCSRRPTRSTDKLKKGETGTYKLPLRGRLSSFCKRTNTGEVKITIASKGAHRATQTQTDEISYAWQGAIGFIFKDNSHITT